MSRKKRRWEHEIVTDSKSDLHSRDALSAMGMDGWELVSVIHHNGAFYFYMKRKLRGKPKTVQPIELAQATERETGT